MQIVCKVNNKQYYADIVLEPDDDGFYVFCPVLKGLHTCGKTEGEAIDNSRDAITAYIQSLLKHGEPVPLYSEELVMV